MLVSPEGLRYFFRAVYFLLMQESFCIALSSRVLGLSVEKIRTYCSRSRICKTCRLVPFLCNCTFVDLAKLSGHRIGKKFTENKLDQSQTSAQ